MAQTGQSDYGNVWRGDEMHEGLRGDTNNRSDIAERARTMGSEVLSAIEERPYTTLAIAAGLAFAVGALWKLNHRPQSRWDAWRSSLPELPSAESWNMGDQYGRR